jgi:hypothetical protein
VDDLLRLAGLVCLALLDVRSNAIFTLPAPSVNATVTAPKLIQHSKADTQVQPLSAAHSFPSIPSVSELDSEVDAAVSQSSSSQQLSAVPSQQLSTIPLQQLSALSSQQLPAVPLQQLSAVSPQQPSTATSLFYVRPNSSPLIRRPFSSHSSTSAGVRPQSRTSASSSASFQPPMLTVQLKFEPNSTLLTTLIHVHSFVSVDAQSIAAGSWPPQSLLTPSSLVSICLFCHLLT